MMKGITISAALVLTSHFVSVWSGPVALDTVCPSGRTILSESYIGEHKNVRVQYVSCSDSGPVQARAPTPQDCQDCDPVSTVTLTSTPSPITSSTGLIFLSGIPATSVTTGPTPTPPSVPNVCGAQCNTNCFNPSGGGPDPNDCHVIADALRFESQNTGNLFPIGTGSNNPIVMTYNSCESLFVNQDSVDVTYCKTDWAGVIDFVAPNCQATQNAHGGNCVASNQEWFIQVQHS